MCPFPYSRTRRFKQCGVILDRMRILLVDDDPDIRLITGMLLEAHGHNVVTAADGAEGVEAAKSVPPPHVVLLDLNMPVMDGFTAARRMREMPSVSRALIIAVSAYLSDKAWCDRALAAGVDECLVKPLDYDRLARLLEGAAPH